MERYSTLVIIKSMPIKLQWGITSHWSQCPSLKRSTKNNTAEDVQKRESSYSLGGKVNGEATLENSPEVPGNTKQRGIIWSCSPFPGLDLEKLIIWNDMCTPVFKVAPFTTAKTWNHQNVQGQKNEDYVAHLQTGILLSQKTEKVMILAAAQMYQEIIILSKVSQGERLLP